MVVVVFGPSLIGRCSANISADFWPILKKKRQCQNPLAESGEFLLEANVQKPSAAGSLLLIQPKRKEWILVEIDSLGGHFGPEKI